MFASPAEVTILKSAPQEIAVFFVFLIKIIFSKKKEPAIKPVLNKAITKH